VARDFNGTTDRLLQGSAFSGGSLGIGTFSCWIKTSSTTIRCAWGVIETGNTGIAALYINTQNGSTTTNGSVTWQIRDGSGFQDLGYVASTGINDGAWHHVVVVRNAGTTRLYIDGTERTLTFSNNTLGSSSITFARPVAIGARNIRGVYDQYFLGEVAHWAEWDVELSLSDVESLNDGAVPEMVRPSSLVNYYPLAGGDPELDIIGLNNLGITGTSVTDDPGKIYYPAMPRVISKKFDATTFRSAWVARRPAMIGGGLR
jgi:hypothetical protein